MNRISLICAIITLYCSVLHTQWSSDPSLNTPIFVSIGYQSAASICGSAGGAIISWGDARNGEYTSDVFVQKLNAAGVLEWINTGLPICTATNRQKQLNPAIITDGAGGAIITWQDFRNYQTTSGDIYSQKVSSKGVLLWKVEGVPVCTVTGDQRYPNIVSDGSGGAIIAWQDYRTSPAIRRLYMQKINAKGVAQWTSTGVLICTAVTSIRYNTTMVSDGSGGAIITWTTGIDVFAQKVDASGTAKWATNGLLVCRPAGHDPAIVSDGEGGAIITWYDYRNGTSTNFNIYAQRINASGAHQWAAQGVPICTAKGLQDKSAIVSDGAGGAVITWNDIRNLATATGDIYAQKVSKAGVVQWASNGVPICTASGIQTNPAIISDGVGGGIITWWDARIGYQNSDIYAQKVNSNGMVQWTPNGVPVCMALGKQLGPNIISDGGGGAIIMWGDFRELISPRADIYAQHISANGTLGSANGVNENK